MKYTIFADSSADLPDSIIKEFDIRVIPLSVNFGDKEYLNLTSNQFYEMLEKSDDLPTTSQVPPSRFIDAFEEELNKGNKVICVTIGANASGTYQSAVIAKETIESDDIYLIDSNSLCMGTGYLAHYIARKLSEGIDLEIVLDEVKKLSQNKINVFFCVDTLKYLKKGGRISAPKAIIAETLGIKPILTVTDGITVPIHKIRGKKRVQSYYISQLKENFDESINDIIYVGHAMDPEAANRLAKGIKTTLDYKGEIVIFDIGPIIGTHAGPGVIALFYRVA